MKDSDIRDSLKNKRLKLSFWQLESHYSIVLFFFIPYFVVIYTLIRDWVNSTTTEIHPTFVNVIIGGTILGILAFWFQRRRLNFQEVQVKPTDELKQHLVNRIKEKNDWQLLRNSKLGLVVKTHPKWTSGSWGEQVTILYDYDKFLINSICDPDKRSSVVSYGRNSSNVLSIKNLLENPIAKSC